MSSVPLSSTAKLAQRLSIGQIWEAKAEGIGAASPSNLPETIRILSLTPTEVQIRYNNIGNQIRSTRWLTAWIMDRKATVRNSNPLITVWQPLTSLPKGRPIMLWLRASNPSDLGRPIFTTVKPNEMPPYLTSAWAEQPAGPDLKPLEG